jgi:DNA-binding MurR/RpiR family transcriptional regulator
MPRKSPLKAHTTSTGSELPLLQRIRSELSGYTAAERAIANHILSNHLTLSYETAASLAEKVGVSAVTVGRYARLLGFRHFKAMKNELKGNGEASPWLIGNELAKFVDPGDGRSARDSSLEREFNALVATYRITEQPVWSDVVSLLSKSKLVHVAGFQTERGIAMILANHLQFMRDGIRLVDTTAGNYADVFASDLRDCCLVLLDIRRYSRQSYLVAEQASQAGIPLIVITDTFCDWASKFTPNVISVPTQTGMFWSSPVALVCAVNLLVNDVIKAIGPDVEQRLEKLTHLHQTFTGYVGHPPPGPRRP